MSAPVPDLAWNELEGLLSRPVATGFNIATEACSRHAARDPGKLALIVVDEHGASRKWTFAELDRLSAQAANLFARVGLRPGDRVAAVLSRQVESWIVALAAWRCGLTYVPLFCGFGSDALSYRLSASAARLIVTDHRWAPTLVQAVGTLDQEPHLIEVSDPRRGVTLPGAKDFWSELERSSSDAPVVNTAVTDLAVLMFTSGTSGNPKSCTMPHGGALSVLPFARWAMGLSDSSRLFTTADPGWSYGLLTTGAAPMILGVARVMYSGDFVPERWRQVMIDHDVTCVAAAPAAYRRLVGAFETEGTPRSLRTATAAGEPLNAAVAERWAAIGAPAILDGYGLSEVGMVLGDLALPPTGTRPGTLAGPIPGFDVRLVHRDGSPVDEGEQGLIAIARPRYQLSTGYENVPDVWASRWVDELFVTEDLAAREPDGRWRFVARADDMIVANGHNISPAEVENALMRHRGVAEVAVVAGEDEARGTVVRAVVVVAPGTVPGPELEADLRAEVAARVSNYAVPRIVEFVEALPRTEVGKVRRVSLRS